MSDAEAKLKRIREIVDKLDTELKEARAIINGEYKPARLPSNAPIFPEPYGEMVDVTDQGTYWQIKPRQFLGTENFAEIARFVKAKNGEYVSAGKSSHFRVPK
jgi:hypothetical protein